MLMLLELDRKQFLGKISVVTLLVVLQSPEQFLMINAEMFNSILPTLSQSLTACHDALSCLNLESPTQQLRFEEVTAVRQADVSDESLETGEDWLGRPVTHDTTVGGSLGGSGSRVQAEW